jgi:2-polyprenyl-3-methyl-5-hydroxy-6-metoxy-1,4-benzoquinol methylase
VSLFGKAKETIRRILANRIRSRLYLRYLQRRRGANVEHLFKDSLSDRFSAIYRNRVWLNGADTGTLSGLGSEIEHTHTIREQLPQLLAEMGTRTLVDVGCGDFNWMKEIQLPCAYIGVDVVPEVIEANKAKYESDSRKFYLLDATSHPVPKGDTALCREILIHLSFADTARVIENIRRSGAVFFIATNETGSTYNHDILSGGHRALNLLVAPFFFPQPTLTIADASQAPGRSLSVWRIADIPILRMGLPPKGA